MTENSSPRSGLPVFHMNFIASGHLLLKRSCLHLLLLKVLELLCQKA
jgi:hypothetical protein